MDDERLTELIGRLDRPEAPDPAFADDLFERLRTSLDADPGRRARSPLFVVLAAAIVLALGAGAAVAVSSGLVDLPFVGQPSPSPSMTAPTPEPTESAAPTPSPSETASSSATPTPVPTENPAGVAPGDLVRTAVESLTVRVDAGTDAEALGALPLDSIGFVLDGPSVVEGVPWYQLSGPGLPYASGCLPDPPGELVCPTWFGWVAGANAEGDAWIVESANPSDCPAEPTLREIAFLQSTLRLACYGDRELTLRGFYPEIPVADGFGGFCSARELDSGWLVCQNINYDGLAFDETSGEFPGVLDVNLDPATDLTMPARGQWLEVTGHFDDAASAGCADAGELMGEDPDLLVFRCRLEFVLSGVEPVAGP